MKITIYDMSIATVKSIDSIKEMDSEYQYGLNHTEITVPQHTVDRWIKCLTEYWAVQQEMTAFHDAEFSDKHPRSSHYAR